MVKINNRVHYILHEQLSIMRANYVSNLKLSLTNVIQIEKRKELFIYCFSAPRKIATFHNVENSTYLYIYTNIFGIVFFRTYREF